MATLQLEFNCLCLFVRDEKNDVVHVLMPSTNHPGMEPHVVRMFHSSFTAHPKGRSMEGLEWVLGPEKGSADFLSLRKNDDGEIVDVTRASGDSSGHNGKKADKKLVTSAHHHVLTRVTLRGGRVFDRFAKADWELKGNIVRMAHQVVWEIDDVPDTLTWHPLNKPDDIPLTSLKELGPEEPLPAPDGTPSPKMGHRLRIFHTTKEGLPPNDENGALDEVAVRKHFRHFYDLIGHPVGDDDDALPKKPVVRKRFDIKTFNCGTGQALLDQ
ncbi:MAG TPA: hypothetical protein VF006_29490 [Longimicrobium sp.]